MGVEHHLDRRVQRFGAVGQPRRGHPLAATTLDWAPALSAIAVGVTLLVLVARRLPVAQARFVLGAAAGLLFGLQSSLTEVSIGYICRHGPGAFVHYWQPWVLVAVPLYGALVIQSA